MEALFRGMDKSPLWMMGDMKEYLLLMLILKLLDSEQPENEAPLMFGRRSGTPQQMPTGLGTMEGGTSEY